MLVIFSTLRDANDPSIQRLLVLLLAVPRNETAWEEFFDRYQAPLFRMVTAALRKYTGGYRAQDVYDLVQDLYQRLLDNDGQALRRFRGTTDRQFCAYLAQICYHLAHDFRVKNTSSNPVPFEGTSPVDAFSAPAFRATVEPDQETTVQRRELRELIAHSLQKLAEGDEKHRHSTIFMLRCYEQRSAEEVAALLGISITSVHTTYHRTRMKLETALADALCKHRKNSTNCCKILEVRTVFYNCAVRGLS